MLKKVVKSSVLLALAVSSINAAAFNDQAEMDRKAVIKYFEDKFEDAEKNKDKFFQYSTDEELKKFIKGVKHNEFATGTYSYNSSLKELYMQNKEAFLPFEDNIAKGEQFYNKSLKGCFPASSVANEYPKFDEGKKAVVSLSEAINGCLTANGGKAMGSGDKDMQNVQAFMAAKATEAGKVVDIKINSKEAADAYERGKKYFYSQRGYLKMSCATCHVQGAGQRVRNEFMSPVLGATTHFPAYRTSTESLFTLEKRMGGCINDTGQKPPKENSKDMQELLYFMGYMSNGMKIDGPDLRK
ncbi:MAG: sulfur oxidation c-type cytochrome SoxA [Epsilonproteobacteria bacterium]|nr:sulfur oxidation c-type cytochrome SoxA [Campylobacterota bacterium]